MKNFKVLLLGSGHCAAPCLKYLAKQEYSITIASNEINQANTLASLLSVVPKVVRVDIIREDEDGKLENLIKSNDIVIGLVPANLLVPNVFKYCIKHSKHLISASYISEEMAKYNDSAKDISILCEIGVDPGIDHIYAIKKLNEIKSKGEKVKSFISYCGGLPADKDCNPIGYKFSWNPKGALVALLNDATYTKDSKIVNIKGGRDLMNSTETIDITIPPNSESNTTSFEGYPNRDSNKYISKYGLSNDIENIVRGSLRHKGFSTFMRGLMDIGLFNDEMTDHELLSPNTRMFVSWNMLICSLLNVNDKSKFESAISTRTGLYDNDLRWFIDTMKEFGLLDDEASLEAHTTILDTLCAKLSTGKMEYKVLDKDMIVLEHRFDIIGKGNLERTEKLKGVWFGDDEGSAMSKTVGTAVGVACRLVLEQEITQKGVFAPLNIQVATLLIDGLKKEGIEMQ